jgi:hypothetical protein
VALAAVISFIIPGRAAALPAELMARTSPNLLDLGIALAAGAAGAYGQVRRHAADALTGVAVAVALVPPLAVVGITLQLTEWQLAVGAGLLFLANVVGIVIAASATFIAAGFVPGRNPLKGHTQILRAVSWAAIAAIIVVLPMQFGRGAVLPEFDPTEEVTAVVEEYVAERGSTSEVIDADVEVDDGVTKIDVVVASSMAAPLVGPLAELLADYLSSPVQLHLLVASTGPSKHPPFPRADARPRQAFLPRRVQGSPPPSPPNTRGARICASPIPPAPPQGSHCSSRSKMKRAPRQPGALHQLVVVVDQLLIRRCPISVAPLRRTIPPMMRISPATPKPFI